MHSSPCPIPELAVQQSRCWIQTLFRLRLLTQYCCRHSSPSPLDIQALPVSRRMGGIRTEPNRELVMLKSLPAHGTPQISKRLRKVSCAIICLHDRRRRLYRLLKQWAGSYDAEWLYLTPETERQAMSASLG
jgi:hypothetical protein